MLQSMSLANVDLKTYQFMLCANEIKNILTFQRSPVSYKIAEVSTVDDYILHFAYRDKCFNFK